MSYLHCELLVLPQGPNAAGKAIPPQLYVNRRWVGAPRTQLEKQDRRLVSFGGGAPAAVRARRRDWAIRRAQAPVFSPAATSDLRSLSPPAPLRSADVRRSVADMRSALERAVFVGEAGAHVGNARAVRSCSTCAYHLSFPLVLVSAPHHHLPLPCGEPVCRGCGIGRHARLGPPLHRMKPGEAHLLDGGFGGRKGSITPYPKPKKLDMPPWKAKANDGHSFLRARSEHVLTELHSWGVCRNMCTLPDRLQKLHLMVRAVVHIQQFFQRAQCAL